MRTELLRFNGAVERAPAIDAWMREHAGELGAIAHHWFGVMRKCGDEVRELLHDGCPVACLGDAPFGYVSVFTSHVNVGFFHGAALSDPARFNSCLNQCGLPLLLSNAYGTVSFRRSSSAAVWEAATLSDLVRMFLQRSVQPSWPSIA